MDLDNILYNSHSRWMEASGPDSDVVLSSRVRLARNLEDVPFPPRMGSEGATRVLHMIERALPDLNKDPQLGPVGMVSLDSLSGLDRQVLVEKHLISPQHAEHPRGRAIILREDEILCIMVNEEDHLRIQSLQPGMALDQAWQMAAAADDVLEGRLAYAFCQRRGYLTTCPTNVGTGLRGSVMVHLPALTMVGQARNVFSALGKLGLAVRGLYGEGSEAHGNVFQISNQTSLGPAEEEILRSLKAVTSQVVGHERNARKALLAQTRPQLEDRVWRAYGLLTNARVMSSEEAIRLWSDVRLGVDLEIISGEVSLEQLNELLVASRPGFIQKVVGRELDPGERDMERAALIRHRLRGGHR
ncbi:MAG TPA: protein arginine kinase [Firmicutes bacterium]|nr:protein arginine kinase [Bacillota bacterium]